MTAKEFKKIKFINSLYLSYNKDWEQELSNNFINVTLQMLQGGDYEPTKELFDKILQVYEQTGIHITTILQQIIKSIEEPSGDGEYDRRKFK